MTTDFMTPREAAMAAELAELRAKLAYLEKSLPEGMILWPTTAVLTMEAKGEPPGLIVLPGAGSVTSSLGQDGKLSVIGTWRGDGLHQISVNYYADGDIVSDPRFGVNTVLPRLHQQFIMTLGEQVKELYLG